MSGGYFEYKQYALDDIISSIDQIIRDIEQYEFRDQKTIEEFRNALDVCKRARVYVHRIDWFLSGDDSEETFHERLKEELTNE